QLRLGRLEDPADVALGAAALVVGVELLGAVLEAQHRPVVGRLVALVLAGGVGVGEVLVAGERVVVLVADVVVHVVRAVADTRGRDQVVAVEQVVLVGPAVRGERAGGTAVAVGRQPVRQVAGVGLDVLDLDEVVRDRPGDTVAVVVRLTAAVLTAVLAAVVLTATVLAAVVLASAVLTAGRAAGAPGQPVQVAGSLAAGPVDLQLDAVEQHLPPVLERTQNGVLDEVRVPGLRAARGDQALVGVGDLLVHRGQFAVDLATRPVRHVAQLLAHVRTVDRDDLRHVPFRPVVRRLLVRRWVDVRPDQPAPTER